MNKLAFLVRFAIIVGFVGLIFYGLGSILKCVQWRKQERQR